MKNNLLCLLLLIAAVAYCSDVGYQVTNVTSYTPLKRSGRSVLYQIDAKGVKDDRPLKLLELIGSHYMIGYDYGMLLSDEIVITYKNFMNSRIPKRWQLLVLEMFLDWQFNSYVVRQIQPEFQDELLGLRDAGYKTGNYDLHRLVKRILVVSSYPGDIRYDIGYTLLDEFIRAFIPKKHEAVLMDMLIANKQQYIQWQREYMQKKKLQCSFFAVWGDRTEGGKVFTMRNLDWEANTGVNQNKMVFVYKIDNQIAHATLGFPGVFGALTGMSSAGLTVHEAGLDSHRQTELGNQWTLRLRYIMANAKNLQEAEEIWRSTNNTLGMNHMIGSGNIVDKESPALVMETMANYTAYFRDNDPRQNGTKFIDKKAKKQYTAGFSMPQAVFRTNHGYDPIIRKHLLLQPWEDSDTMARYFLLKDGFNWYNKTRKMNQADALNMTAILGNKGSQNFTVCPKPGPNSGINVISVMYSPTQLKMWVSFEYSFNETFRPACCGVYVEMDMKLWFKA